MTGASGFLGRWLVDTLLKDESELVAVCRRPVEGVRTIRADLTAGEFRLSGPRWSEVYHLAGLAHCRPRNAAERRRYFEVNVEGTRNLLQALEGAGVIPDSLVFVSSVAVYGMTAGELLDEETPRRAMDPYGASKRGAEDLLREWGIRRGVRIGVVRLPLVVGKEAPGNFGAMVRALRAHRYLGVGGGESRRSMVLAGDVAVALPRVAAAGGIYNLTDGRHPSFKEVETALANALNQQTPWRLPLWAARPAALMADIGERISRRRLPFNSRALRIMTSTLTFSDEKARDRIGWRPDSVVEKIPEMFP